jgi:hypothetical protein
MMLKYICMFEGLRMRKIVKKITFAFVCLGTVQGRAADVGEQSMFRKLWSSNAAVAASSVAIAVGGVSFFCIKRAQKEKNDAVAALQQAQQASRSAHAHLGVRQAEKESLAREINSLTIKHLEFLETYQALQEQYAAECLATSRLGMENRSLQVECRTLESQQIALSEDFSGLQDEHARLRCELARWQQHCAEAHHREKVLNEKIEHSGAWLILEVATLRAKQQALMADALDQIQSIAVAKSEEIMGELSEDRQHLFGVKSLLVEVPGADKRPGTGTYKGKYRGRGKGVIKKP